MTGVSSHVQGLRQCRDAETIAAMPSEGAVAKLVAQEELLLADLHVHTTVSDGSLTFAEALDEARDQGVDCIAFTNHDTTRGLDEARELGVQAGIRVIGGVEISAFDFDRGRKVHVLGYGLREGSPSVEALCAPQLARRDANSRWQLQQLLDAGYAVNRKLVLMLAARSTALYKQHIMAALTTAPHNSPEYTHLYRSLFKGDGIAVRDIDYVDARAAVRAIVEDGGIAVLAHPGQLDSYDFVPELVACGLSGIEQHHPDHTPLDRGRCAVLAQRFDLLLTGGSDYHGAYGRPPCIGHRYTLLPPNSPLLKA